MTGAVNMLLQFRDIQVAENVRKMVELGWTEVEFTMYGCAYLDRQKDKMYYKVSNNVEDIYDFIESSAGNDIFPSKIEQLSLKCPVPMGTKHLIERDIKTELARKMHEKYEKSFFRELYQIAESIQNNQARNKLWADVDALEGTFDELGLEQFEKLLEYSYSCRKLEREEYKKLKSWLTEEKKSMEDNVVEKDIFEKTMYGTVYEENEKLKYISNARRKNVYKDFYEKEKNGILVGPIHKKTCWYNYNHHLSDIIFNYKQELKQLYNEQYIEKLKQIRGKTMEEDKKKYTEKLTALEKTYGKDCAETAKRYFFRWGII